MTAVLLGAMPATAEVTWRSLEPGLDLAAIKAPVKSSHGDSTITVVRIDPRRFRFKLISAKELKTGNRPASGWAKRFGLLAAVNAGMFLQDHKTSVGFMRNGAHVNNPRMAREMNLVLAFNPRAAGLPPVRIIDLKLDDFGSLKGKYGTLIQSLRMIDGRGRNRWGVAQKKWSVVTIATTRAGKVLFVHARSPYRMRVFGDMILKLPLDVRAMIYLEGGPEATLYLNAGGVAFEKVGSYETGFRPDDTNKEAWALPNVVGVVRRGKAGAK